MHFARVLDFMALVCVTVAAAGLFIGNTLPALVLAIMAVGWKAASVTTRRSHKRRSQDSPLTDF